MNAILKPLSGKQRRYKTALERIENNTATWWPEKPGPDWDGTPCELWMGGRSGSGYGRMCVRVKIGKAKGKPRNVAVHRVVLREHGDPMPKRVKHAMHLCNENLCTKRSHLRWGTQSDNEIYKILSRNHNADTVEREPGEDG